MKPINSHLLIAPLQHKSFLPTDKQSYEEIGIVQGISEELMGSDIVRVGDEVFFDSWLAAKYPKNDDEFYWLVRFDDIRAINRHEENPLPK